MSSREHFSWQAAVYSTDLPPMVKLVLGVISARMNQYGCGAFPSYKTIAKDASIAESTAKASVKAAVAAGWLKKRARLKAIVVDGKPVISNDSNEYEIAFGGGPCDGPGVVREADGGGPCDGPGVVREADTNTPSEHPIEHTFANAQVEPAGSGKQKMKAKKTARVDLLPILIAEGVDEQVAVDFIAHRKAKSSPLTLTALGGIKREAEAAGYTLEMALRECILRAWCGFKAEWVGKQMSSSTRSVKPAAVNRLPKSYGENGRL